MYLVFLGLLFFGLITPFSISTLVLNGLCFGVMFLGLLKFGSVGTTDCHTAKYWQALNDKLIRFLDRLISQIKLTRNDKYWASQFCHIKTWLVKYDKIALKSLAILSRDLFLGVLFLVYGGLYYWQWGIKMALIGLVSVGLGFIVSKKFIKEEKWFIRVVLGLMFLQIVNFAVFDGKNLRQ